VELRRGSWGTAEAAASAVTSPFQAAPVTASEGAALVTGQPEPDPACLPL